MCCVQGRANRTCWIFWMNPRRGEIWLADLGLAAKTLQVEGVSRFDGKRPGIGSLPTVRLERKDRRAAREYSARNPGKPSRSLLISLA